MFLRKFAFVAVLAAILGVNSHAHYLYINLSGAENQSPKSVAANIGWGHAMPIDDFLQGDMLHSYALFDPNMKRLDFNFDKGANAGLDMKIYSEKPSANFPAATIFEGDAFVKKLYFDKEAPKGVYQFAASNEGVQFSLWLDEKGRQKWGRKYLDELKDAKEIQLCWVFKSYAKAWASVGEWSEPKPLGHPLEFVPISDLTNVKVGDEVEFRVLFMGEPLHSVSPTGGLPDSIKAYNELLGDTFVGAYVKRGKLKFRVLKPGRWLMTLNVTKPVSQKVAPELVGKVYSVGYNATATFFVKDK